MTRTFLLGLALAVLGGCVPTPAPTAPTTPNAPPASLAATSALSDLHIDNTTTKTITVLVNGVTVSTVEPGQLAFVSASALPAGTWSVDARLPGGRSVLRAQLQSTPAFGSGSGARVDLSCGRLDIWVGSPPLGPVPASGTPGDCDG